MAELWPHSEVVRDMEPDWAMFSFTIAEAAEWSSALRLLVLDTMLTLVDNRGKESCQAEGFLQVIYI